MEYVVRWIYEDGRVEYTGIGADDHWSEALAQSIAISGTIPGKVFGRAEMKTAISLKNKLNRFLVLTGRSAKYDTGNAKDFYN